MLHPTKWPDWLENPPETALIAKSADRTPGDSPETLAEHTWFVLQRLSELIKLRPTLPQEIGVPNLWHILFWSAFMHDFGKAAQGFQNRLRGGSRWAQRHEVLSLAFVNWITTGLTTEEQIWLVAAIVSHHRDASYILDIYRREARDQLTEMVTELSEPTIRGLWRWLHDCPADWLATLGLTEFGIKLLPIMPENEAVTLVDTQGGERIYHWLKRYKRFMRDEVEDYPAQSFITATLTLRGYLINADHAASSHQGHLPTINLDTEHILRVRQINPHNLYRHQRQAGETAGSVLLTAPTGSGKTEAALLWASYQAQKSANSPRLFYTLPYQASMNAMWLRLKEIFGTDENGEELVGLQHGRATLAYYRMSDEEDDMAQKQARQAKDRNKLNYPPIRISSPYQMLKGPYRVKGYEMLLSDYHHALFIFDEIHAYEAKRLALILETVRYLRQNFQASFLVMSATFPKLIKEVLQEALGQPAEITADDALFQAEEFQRHQLRLREGKLLDDLEAIAEATQQHTSVLVVCNLVANAQQVYAKLKDRLSETKIALLHGRFNMRDRSRLEAMIRRYASADLTETEPFVLVATQAVEVSLDVDFATLYTEPAPLDALVQRFGRVNRRGKRGLSEVHVYRDWDEDQDHIYHRYLVEPTMTILEREQNQPINEQKIGGWLDEIYQGEAQKNWQQDYQEYAEQFRASWLKTLQPFEAIRGRQEQQFYQLFDGTEILPTLLLAEYKNLVAEKRYLEASELLVPITFRQFKRLENSQRLTDELGDWPKVADVDYNSELGLQLSQAK